MNTEPQKEHEWLQQLLGEWTYESECMTEPGKPPEKFQGSEHVRALGDLVMKTMSKSLPPIRSLGLPCALGTLPLLPLFRGKAGMGVKDLLAPTMSCNGRRVI